MKEHLIAFLIYSFIGAIFEHLSYFIASFSKDYKPKMLSNPIITGFPLYGFGAYLIIFTNNFFKDKNILIKFIAIGLILSILEYIIGLMVGAGKNSYNNGFVDAWDYSNEKFNIHGIVSLRHFISWGILGLILEYIHPIIISKILNGIN